MGTVIIPEGYKSYLSTYETQEAIGMIKILMQKKLCMALKLKRVTAPLFVDPASGLNDNLNGVERLYPLTLRSKVVLMLRLYTLSQSGSAML